MILKALAQHVGIKPPYRGNCLKKKKNEVHKRTINEVYAAFIRLMRYFTSIHFFEKTNKSLWFLRIPIVAENTSS